jgi:hypothetical protein
MDLMRFGPEFAREKAPNVRLLVNATAVDIHTDRQGKAFEAVEVSSLGGRRLKIRAKGRCSPQVGLKTLA